MTTTRSPMRPGAVTWARANLFSTWYNALLTVVFIALGILAILAVIGWFRDADFTIVRVNLALFMVGRYPRAELWRVALAMLALGGGLGIAAGIIGAGARQKAEAAGLAVRSTSVRAILRRIWPLLLVVVVLLAITTTITPTLITLGAAALFMLGYIAGRFLPLSLKTWRWLAVMLVIGDGYIYLSAVRWDQWGGLLTNVFVTILGIALAFPFGLLLALARRSSFPAFRLLSVSYIELIRGVPLITLLLLGIYVIGFFLPEGLRPGDLTRVLIAIVAFECAYIAEVVRGGLQSVPSGQTEGAQAVGLSPLRVTQKVVLPQSLRNSIPAMVGQFISLFKDTSLLTIVGIPELLSASGLANTQPDFLGQELYRVTLPFVGLLFWAGSYMMSRESRRLERRLGVGER
ncbi:MAG: ABC transporter permease subunit [Acidimicrobiia bacterium]|nr:ABC transporter permease subunit [Acidimicrobiia bacterium]